MKTRKSIVHKQGRWQNKIDITLKQEFLESGKINEKRWKPYEILYKYACLMTNYNNSKFTSFHTISREFLISIRLDHWTSSCYFIYRFTSNFNNSSKVKWTIWHQVNIFGNIETPKMVCIQFKQCRVCYLRRA